MLLSECRGRESVVKQASCPRAPYNIYIISLSPEERGPGTMIPRCGYVMTMPVKIRPEPMPSLLAEKNRWQSVKVSTPVMRMFRRGTPSRSSCMLHTAGRSMWGFRQALERMQGGNPASRKASTTSSPTSKLSSAIPGPTSAHMLSGYAPF